MAAASDELGMEEALRAAQRALAAGEVPVGAVVLSRWPRRGPGGTATSPTSIPSAHAEIVAFA